jgi:membrane protease YdiL (CAAX protease family)
MMAMVFVMLMGVGLVLFVTESVGGRDPGDMELGTDPPAILMMNLALASLVPLSMVAVWVSHGWRPRWVGSVQGGVRWGWLLLCALVACVVMAPVMLGFLALDGSLRWEPEPDAAWLVAVVLLTTPLQSAGEEYLFRGWLLQAVGSLFRRGVLAVLVSGTVSSVLFALAHGEQDPWLFLDRFAFAALAVWLVWATGGLEAGIALHAANNVTIMIPAILTGTFSSALTATSSDPLSAAVSVVMTGVLTGMLVGLGRWRRVLVVFQPPPRPVPVATSA